MTATLGHPATTPDGAEVATSSRGYRRLVLAHVAVGAAIFVVRPTATVFALFVAVQVVRVCLTSHRADDIAVAIGYLTGTEVLWRMAGARIPWEFTKYLVVFACACGVMRFSLRPGTALPVVYLAVLVPSCVITVLALSLGDAREALVSNILGPAALAATAVFCLSLVATRTGAARFLWSVVLALIPMATFMVLTLATARNLTFSDEASAVASGNFGPNQVSTALSIGLLAVFLLITVIGERRYRVLLLGLGAWMLIAMLLTFSRGGLVSVAVAVTVATAVLMADARRFLATIAIVGTGAILLIGLVIPSLDSFTGGSLSRRYSDTSTAHRSSIAESDWGIFRDAPLVGVGVGRSPEFRGEGDAQGRQSHVTYTRLLAEHGLLGAVAVAALAALGVRACRRAGSRPAVAWSAALIAWSMVTMAHADTRLAAVGVAFGFGCLVITRTQPDVVRSAVPRFSALPASFDARPGR